MASPVDELRNHHSGAESCTDEHERVEETFHLVSILPDFAGRSNARQPTDESAAPIRSKSL
jgi:hypothetical protein